MRTLTLEAIEPGPDPVCLLTRDEAALRAVPPDAFFDRAEYGPTDDGYVASLPRSDAMWAMASAFIEEERRCCPTLAFALVEHDDRITLRAAHRSAPATTDR